MVEQVEKTQPKGMREIFARDRLVRVGEEEVAEQQSIAARPVQVVGVVGSVVLIQQHADEVGASAPLQVAVDHIVMQQEREVQDFDRRRDTHRGGAISSTVTGGGAGREGVERGKQEPRAQHLPAQERVGGRAPQRGE